MELGQNRYRTARLFVDNGKGNKHSTPQGRHICCKFANAEDSDGSCGIIHCCQFCLSTSHNNAGHQEGSHGAGKVDGGGQDEGRLVHAVRA